MKQTDLAMGCPEYRDFKATEPGQKWMGDITYIPTKQGFLYLAAIIDLLSRKIVGLAMADHMQSSLVEIESFWGTLKTECASGVFDTRTQARTEIFSYIMGFYNTTRLHSALDYVSPCQFEQAYLRSIYCPN